LGESCGTVGFYMWEGRRGLEGWRLMWLGVFGLIYGAYFLFCLYSYFIFLFFKIFFSPGNFQKFPKFLRKINRILMRFRIVFFD